MLRFHGPFPLSFKDVGEKMWSYLGTYSNKGKESQTKPPILYNCSKNTKLKGRFFPKEKIKRII